MHVPVKLTSTTLKTLILNALKYILMIEENIRSRVRKQFLQHCVLSKRITHLDQMHTTSK